MEYLNYSKQKIQHTIQENWHSPTIRTQYVNYLLKNRIYKEAEKVLDKIHITVNKNTIPYDNEKPFTTSGIRLGSAAMTTRGFKEEEFIKLTNIIYKALTNINDENILEELSKEVLKLTNKFPIDNI